VAAVAVERWRSTTVSSKKLWIRHEECLDSRVLRARFHGTHRSRKERDVANHQTKSLGTKLTEGEFAQCQALAGTLPLSEWVRGILLRAVQPDAALHQAMLAEVLALRTIVLNLHFASLTGHELTADYMQTLIDRADEDKWSKAQERMTAAVARGRA
jgi:hypothetical protein